MTGHNPVNGQDKDDRFQLVETIKDYLTLGTHGRQRAINLLRERGFGLSDIEQVLRVAYEDLHPSTRDQATETNRFQPAVTLTRVVMGLLGLLVVLHLAAVYVDWSERALVQRLQSEDLPYTSQQVDALARHDTYQNVIETAQVILIPLTVLFLMLWVRRRYINTQAFGTVDMRYSPGWAWLGFLIPILNLWLPHAVTQEIWRASNPKLDTNRSIRWQQSRGSLVMLAWWSLSIISLLLLTQTSRGPNNVKRGTVVNLHMADQLVVGVDGLAALAAILGILVVYRIHRRQLRKHHQIQTAPDLTLPPLD